MSGAILPHHRSMFRSEEEEATNVADPNPTGLWRFELEVSLHPWRQDEKADDPTRLASHRLTQYHGELFHGFWSILGSPGTQELNCGAVHRRSLGNQAGICLPFPVWDCLRNSGEFARTMHRRFTHNHPGIPRSLLQDT